MRNVMSLLLSAVLCVTVSGCGKGSIQETLSETDHTPVFRGVPESGKDLIYNYWDFLEEYIDYDSLEEMVAESEAVILGEITDYVFMNQDVFFKTVENVKIIETIYGDLEPGSEIRIVKEGGYIPADEYFRMHNVTEDFIDQTGKKIGDYSKQELKTKYVGYISDYYQLPVMNHQYLLFIRQSRAVEGFYTITGDPCRGEYEMTDVSMYYLPFFADRSETGELNENAFFTYEQLKEKIRTAAQ